MTNAAGVSVTDCAGGSASVPVTQPCCRVPTCRKHESLAPNVKPPQGSCHLAEQSRAQQVAEGAVSCTPPETGSVLLARPNLMTLAADSAAAESRDAETADRIMAVTRAGPVLTDGLGRVSAGLVLTDGLGRVSAGLVLTDGLGGVSAGRQVR